MAFFYLDLLNHLFPAYGTLPPETQVYLQMPSFASAVYESLEQLFALHHLPRAAETATVALERLLAAGIV